MYVIKFNNKYYWCGYNHVDTQLRKAVIYNSKNIAISAAEDCLKRKSAIKSLEQFESSVSYEIVEVELREREIEDIRVVSFYFIAKIYKIVKAI